MRNNKQIYSAFLVLILFVTGCSTWENFTTYFNVYYNAKLNYDEAMEDITKNEKDIFEFKEKPVSTNADKALTKVIEKCSAILQFNAESAYFDDALFIIGVAYYYKQNYSRALRKFKELEAVPETDLVLNNKLWIGKTLLQLRSFDEGNAELEDVKKIAAEEDETEILEEAYQTQIAFHFFQENYQTAVEIINDFLASSENEETKAEVAFQLGKIYLELEEYDKAINAFASVENYNPTIKTEFDSKIELAKTNRILENRTESLNILQSLRDEDKYDRYRDVIFYQLGTTNLELGELENAIDNFLTVDSMKVTSEKEMPGLSRIKLGEIWEYELMDYDSAMKYYNKSASSILEPDEKSYAISKITLFRNYNNLSQNIFKNEKQLLYITNPEEFVQDSIDYEDYLFELKQDSLDNSIGNNVANDVNSIRNTARALQSSNQLQQGISKIKPQRPTLTSDTLKIILSKDKYDLGNMFFIEFEVPDSALYYYEDVLENYPPNKITPNVKFALGSYYLSIDDTLKSDSIFQSIYEDYQGLNVAQQAARRLGLLEFDVETDTSAQYYLEAENKFLDKNYSEAIRTYFTLAEKFPQSVLAPKALYTAGWILENELNNLDSAAVVYDTLNSRYEKSLYSKEVIAKLNFYKQENLQKKIQDSLDAAESQVIKEKPTLPSNPGNSSINERVKEEENTNYEKIKLKEERRGERFIENNNIITEEDSLLEKLPPRERLKETLKADSTITPDSLKKKVKPLLK